MKRILKMLGLVFLGLTLVAGGLTLFDQSNSSASAATKVKTSKKVSGVDKDTLVVDMPAADHGWLSGVAYYAQQECKALHLKKYRVITAANVNDQTSQLNELTNQKVGAIVLEPYTGELSVAARKVVKSNIPLVIFDRKVNANYNGFVAGSNTEIGKTSADYLGSKLNGKGTIAVLSVPSSGSVSSERVGGFKKEMKAKYPNIKLVTMTADAFTQKDGLQTGQDMLTAHKHVDAIYSIDDESSMGILQAIKEAKRTDVKYLSGCGGSQAYLKKIKNNKDSIKLFTATYSPTMMRIAVREANSAMHGKKIPKNKIIKTNIVTKSNVNKFMDSNSPY